MKKLKLSDLNTLKNSESTMPSNELNKLCGGKTVGPYTLETITVTPSGNKDDGFDTSIKDTPLS